MFFWNVYSIAGARNGGEVGLRRPPCGNHALGCGRILLGAGYCARRACGSEPRGPIRKLCNKAGKPFAEFSARKCFARYRKACATRLEVQYFCFTTAIWA